MKRRHSFDEYCPEEGIRAKRIRREEEKGDGKDSLNVSTLLSSDSQTSITPSLCDEASLLQCKKDTVHKSIIARAFVISEELTSSESDTVSYAPYEQEFAACETNVACEKQQDFQINSTIPIINDHENANILTQADILGVLHGLTSAYNLAEMSPQDQPITAVLDGSSMRLVGPQDRVYLSVMPQNGDVTKLDSDSLMLCTVEPVSNQVTQSSDTLKYSQQYTTKSFSDKMKERLENWYYETMDVDHKKANKRRYPSHLLEWSERVKFRHERKWQQLEYHAPDYSTFG